MKLFAAALLLATACTDPGGPGTAPGGTTDPGATPSPRAPRVDVALTDAPGDFESVWVNITTVSVEADSDWKTLADQPQRFDLLTLQNDVTAALGGATLAAGSYGQLRLVVDHASVVVGGVESDLKIASGAQTGIKIPLDQTFEADTVYAVTLDFDAGKSVKTTGQGYLMTPVIQVKSVTGTAMPPAEPEPGTDAGTDPGTDAGSGSGSGDSTLPGP